jgi:hypothetical protein
MDFIIEKLPFFGLGFGGLGIKCNVMTCEVVNDPCKWDCGAMTCDVFSCSAYEDDPIG